MKRLPALLGSGLRRGTFDPRQQRSRVCLGVRLQQDFRKNARARRRHLLRNLVGLQLDQRIVLGNRVADLFQPGTDDRLGALLLVGNADFDQAQNSSSRSISARIVAGDGSAHSISLG